MTSLRFRLLLLMLLAGSEAFAVDKVIDGGAGTDTVAINYTGLTGLQDFPTRSLDSDYKLTLVDADSNTITLANILDLTLASAATGISVAGIDYDFTDFPVGQSEVQNQRLYCTMHGHYAGSSRGIAVDTTNKVFVAYKPDTDSIQNSDCTVAVTSSQQGGVGSNVQPFRADYTTTAMTVYGYSHTDYVQTSSKADTIYTYAGNDQVLGKTGADTINLGDGDDIAFVTLTDLNEDTLVGGNGSDTLNFGRVVASRWHTYANEAESWRAWTHDFGVTANLADLLVDSGKNISGFENLVGTETNDTLTGDANANILVGGLGADTLSGAAGDDIIYDDLNATVSSENLYAGGNTDIYGQYISSTTDSTAGNDTLNGNDGNDTLIASTGDDTLDGGDGADTLTGGAGIDTFIIRSGDGGDTITDFTDTTDLIGMAGLSYAELSFEQSGNDTLIKKGTETLSIIQNITLDKINYYDIVSTSTDALTRTGTSDDDVLLGGSGNDTFATGSGTDVILGYGGNDGITINGSGNKTIDGGAGTNTVAIAYGSLSGLQDFTTRSLDSDYKLTLVDADSNTITLANILDLTLASAATGISVAGIDYDFTDFPVGQSEVQNQRLYCTMHGHYAGSSRGIAVDTTNKVFVAYKPDTDSIQNSDCTVAVTSSQQGGVGSNVQPFRADYTTTAMTVYGYSHTDYVQTSSKADTIYTYAGNDQVLGKAGADTINLGDGDDIAFVTLTDLNEDTLIGGNGSDTLNFGRVVASRWHTYANEAESWRAWTHDFGVTANLADLLVDSGKNISGFENLVGTETNDTLTGDANANILVGGLGADTLSGAAGDDTIYDDLNATVSSENLYAGGNTDIYGQYISSTTDSTAGNDTLNGNDGNDTLIASTGDDTLDGGDGADTLTGGAGIDTFIIRSGDGGDTITDFTDTTDLIGMAGLSYAELSFEQSGNDTLIKKGTETLSIIQNITLDKINYYDIVSTSTDALTRTGTSDDDALLGGSGNDTFTTGSGTDVILGYGGNDGITINGSGNKTIDGGAGTNTVAIAYGSLSGLQDFPTRSLDSDYKLTLVDADSNTITLANILDLTLASAATGISVAGIDYDFTDFPVGQSEVQNQRLYCTMHGHYAGSSRGIAVDTTNKVFVAYKPDTDSIQNSDCTVAVTSSQQGGVGSNVQPFRADYTTTAMTVYGYSHTDYVQTSSKADTIYTYAGNDQVLGKAGADTINLGDGDDIAFVTLTDLNEDTLIGGNGSDTLNFGRVVASRWHTYANEAESWRAWTHDFGVTANLADLLVDSGKNISGFENLVGTETNDTLTGDANANILVGGLGADTLSGAAGDDTIYDDLNATVSSENLYAGGNTDIYGQYISSTTDSTAGNDTLNGNDGNDTLIASTGDDTLDGGDGADTLTGGAGTDTFVIRAGDGGLSISDADTITDFTDGTDIIGMSGLNYSDLTREQGTGSYSSHVVVKNTSSGEFFTIIQNISLSSVDDNDFSAI